MCLNLLFVYSKRIYLMIPHCISITTMSVTIIEPVGSPIGEQQQFRLAQRSRLAKPLAEKCIHFLIH